MKALEVTIPVATDIRLKGNLSIPDEANALVIFSGSSRLSSRNRFVAEILNNNHIATLLADLLTEQEDNAYAPLFNVELITERLLAVILYAIRFPVVRELPVGCFGDDAGAASALCAAAQLPKIVKAIVSRGGRPDLAGDALEAVNAPTLLIVGGFDEQSIECNKKAYSEMHGEREVKIINGATHVFEETGKLIEVAQLATDWFNHYLVSSTMLTIAK